VALAPLFGEVTHIDRRDDHHHQERRRHWGVVLVVIMIIMMLVTATTAAAEAKMGVEMKAEVVEHLVMAYEVIKVATTTATVERS